MSDQQKILVTGTKGNLGRKICNYLKAKSQYDLVCLDIVTHGDTSTIQADLSLYNDSWTRCFEGVNVVIHLAADHRLTAPWESLEKHNVDAVINVFEAAVSNGVERVIFASSLATMYGYNEDYYHHNTPLTPEIPARPNSFYGATKILGERLGRGYAKLHGLSVICLRIGWVQPGENNPETFRDIMPWKQARWLSNRDLCQAVERAIIVKDLDYEILNVVSDNKGMSWDIARTCRILGYHPQDSHTPTRSSLKVLMKRRLKRLTQKIL